MAISTTLKLPETLKARIAPLAQSAGKTAHAWMVEALEAQAELAELRRGFLDDALAAAKEIDAGGALYALEDVQAYIAERAAARKPAYPTPAPRHASRSRTRTPPRR